MPDGTTWTTPRGGFFIWVTAPDGVDTVALSAAASARKVAYVPGRPFYPGDDGATQIRLAYSRVADELIDEGVRRLGDLVRTASGGQCDGAESLGDAATHFTDRGAGRAGRPRPVRAHRTRSRRSSSCPASASGPCSGRRR